MCTILVAVSVWPGRPLVIAANRDEALDRPASGPSVSALSSGLRVLAPRDLRAGGTWLGVNELGLFAGITNRRATPHPNRRSRGELVFEALAASDHDQARARLASVSASDYNPFHLVLADRRGAAIVWSDGERLHELSLTPGFHWITERSFGAGPSGRHAILDRQVARLAAGPAPDVEQWRTILAEHASQPSAASIALDGMCVHADPLNYGTRSSTVIELGEAADQLRFFHAIGRPCEVALTEQDVTPLIRAPIQSEISAGPRRAGDETPSLA